MFKTLTIAYNAVHGIAPHYLKGKLKQKHYHRTIRQSTSTGISLDIPLNRKKSFADRGFSYAAAKYLNDLPDNIRTANDIKFSNPCLRHTSLDMHFHNK